MVGRKVEVQFEAPLSWFFRLGDSLCISVECPWRVVANGTIAVSGDDHEQRFGLPEPIDSAQKASSLLAGHVVRNVEVSSGTADLRIFFDKEVQLEIIPFSSGYEGWQVSTPSGETVIAQGGGNLAVVRI